MQPICLLRHAGASQNNEEQHAHITRLYTFDFKHIVFCFVKTGSKNSHSHGPRKSRSKIMREDLYF